MNVLVVAEASEDAALLGSIVDRLGEEVHGDGPRHRVVPLDDATPYLQKSSVPARLDAKRRRAIYGRRRSPEQTVLLRIALLDLPAEVLLFHTDTDGDDRHGPAWRKAAVAVSTIRWLLALPHPEKEGWFLWAAALEPQHVEAGETLKRNLGVNPVRTPHRLSSSPKSPKDTKRICRDLGIDRGHLDAAPIAHLRSAPPETGLPAFLADVEAWLQTF